MSDLSRKTGASKGHAQSKANTTTAPRRRCPIEGCVMIDYPTSATRLIEFNEALFRYMQATYSRLGHCFEDDEYPQIVPPMLDDLGEEYEGYTDDQKNIVLNSMIKDHVIEISGTKRRKEKMYGELLSLFLDDADEAIRSHEDYPDAASDLCSLQLFRVSQRVLSQQGADCSAAERTYDAFMNYNKIAAHPGESTLRYRRRFEQYVRVLTSEDEDRVPNEAEQAYHFFRTLPARHQDFKDNMMRRVRMEEIEQPDTIEAVFRKAKAWKLPGNKSSQESETNGAYLTVFTADGDEADAESEASGSVFTADKKAPQARTATGSVRKETRSD